jgi:hypothetical protein
VLYSNLTCIFIQRTRKLVDHWGHLKTPLQNGSLTLQTNVFRPADEMRHIALGLDALTNPKVPRTLLNQWIPFQLLLPRSGNNRCCLLYFLFFLFRLPLLRSGNSRCCFFCFLFFPFRLLLLSSGSSRFSFLYFLFFWFLGRLW